MLARRQWYACIHSHQFYNAFFSPTYQAYAPTLTWLIPFLEIGIFLDPPVVWTFDSWPSSEKVVILLVPFFIPTLQEKDPKPVCSVLHKLLMWLAAPPQVHSSPLTYAFIRDTVVLLIIILKCLLLHMSILLVLMALEHPECGCPREAVQALLTEIHKASIWWAQSWHVLQSSHPLKASNQWSVRTCTKIQSKTRKIYYPGHSPRQKGFSLNRFAVEPTVLSGGIQGRYIHMNLKNLWHNK